MTQELKIATLKSAIERFKEYIKNADHTQPVTQEILIDNLVVAGGEKQEFLHYLANRLSTFEKLDYGSAEVLTEIELHLMLEDFENQLEILEL
ncbi:hypothetical protein [Flavobacterium sp. ABG]|uniref:hypothetical protein n=1 Tax=Flavobacterium sp. ABG TaxID=1423322 RepID=UPI00064990FC|nr:hypothetical protein [Flavobacterium sp. ABG]KLT69915.1 hypothetical protein AB674_09430 [Flavobacterium sp. ABG]